MEYLLKNQYSWGNFFLLAFCLLVLYFLLQFISQILATNNYLGVIRLPILTLVERILLLAESIAIFILGSAFILINPLFHGILIALIIMGGFNHVKNYISGRIIQIDKTISLGNKLKIAEQKGIISKIGRLGLQLKTDKGTQFINYSKLLGDGFMLLSGEEIGVYYHLKIIPNEINDRQNYPQLLSDLFVTVPYLDWNYKPNLSTSKEEEHIINAKVMVRENSYLPDLISLVEERGYTCKLVD